MTQKTEQYTPQRDLLERSGIPFQLAVERELRRVARLHFFQVVGREVPWRDGFLDLLARDAQVYLGIECKRVKEDSWTFIVTDKSLLTETRCRLEWYNPRAPQRQYSVHDSNLFCSEFSMAAKSSESEFCVIPKDGAVNSLERVATEVLSACHDILESYDLHHPADRWEAIVPAVVTSARLIICLVEPQHIDLSTGKIDREAATFQEVSWLRFRKTLVGGRSNTYLEDQLSPEAWVADRQRTVLILTPSALETVLEGFRDFRCDDEGGSPKEFSYPDLLVGG